MKNILCGTLIGIGCVYGLSSGSFETKGINKLDKHGYSSLNRVISSYKRSDGPDIDEVVVFMKQLIAASADVNSRVMKGYEKGFTPLYFAARIGDVSIVTLLLNAGADVNAVIKDDGSTPFIIAASRGWRTVALLLLDHKADVNVRLEDSNQTILHLLAVIGRPTEDLFGLLLAAGAEYNVKDSYGQTPLMIAQRNSNLLDRRRYERTIMLLKGYKQAQSRLRIFKDQSKHLLTISLPLPHVLIDIIIGYFSLLDFYRAEQ